MEWQPETGDRFVVDTKDNEGFLIHSDGRYVRFSVATGQRRYVCYIGRCYNAATPEKSWVAKSRDIKGDHMTFGPSGRFLRLYKNGTEDTAYGIHEYGNEARMFAEGERYRSMGCIVVKQAMMDIIDQTYAENGNALDVVTAFGIEDPVRLAFGSGKREV